MRQKLSKLEPSKIKQRSLKRTIQDIIRLQMLGSLNEPLLEHGEAQSLARIYQTATGIFPRHILNLATPQPRIADVSGFLHNHEIEFMKDPSSAINQDELYQLHLHSWPRGLAPSIRQIAYMLRRDSIFAAYDNSLPSPRLVAAVHVRLLPQGSSIGAHDIMSKRRQTSALALKVPITSDASVLCYAAVTHEDYRHQRIAQRLITESVLPYLERTPRTASLLWSTSSPATYSAEVGRRLTSNHEWKKLLLLCNEHLRRHRPLGAGSISDLINIAQEYLLSHWFLRSEPPPDFKDPCAFLRALYLSIPSHADLVNRMNGSEAEHQCAQMMIDRVRKLLVYKTSQSAENTNSTSHLASLGIFFLAFGLAQVDVFDSTTGHSADPIAHFHLSNGAYINSDIGPIPRSRPNDVAAVGFGQQFVYTLDWKKKRESYLEVAEQRRMTCAQKGAKGLLIDWQKTESHMAGIAARLELTF